MTVSPDSDVESPAADSSTSTQMANRFAIEQPLLASPHWLCRLLGAMCGFVLIRLAISK
jgi:hypothetical protein